MLLIKLNWLILLYGQNDDLCVSSELIGSSWQLERENNYQQLNDKNMLLNAIQISTSVSSGNKNYKYYYPEIKTIFVIVIVIIEVNWYRNKRLPIVMKIIQLLFIEQRLVIYKKKTNLNFSAPWYS